ncbi:MAG: sarcosine oxidase gamma subunit [Novosphingobium sp.]|nr:sarcosine oxidase gamma subunit [Novosphingobium sp.]
MPDAVIPTSPLPAVPFVGEGVTVAAAGELSRFSLRARDPARLAAVIGRALPERVGDVADGIVRLGPDEFHALLPAGTDLPLGEGERVSIVEVSNRSVGIVVSGPRAAELLMAGCPLDLAQMTVGRGTRTIFETTEVIIIRQGDAQFHVEVWRSFAPWLWEALIHSA